MADLIHKLLNISLPIISLILATIFLPPFLCFKLFTSCLKSISKEKLAGKVVLITGASSGIGEYLAYEYAKRGACLVLVARREDRLQIVASNAKKRGSPDVLVIPADVSKLQDCKRFIDKAINHFSRLDHLVNNAGIAPFSLFEDYTCVTDHTCVMNINFWGSVYSTQYAVPHLRKSKGRIVVIASVGAWACAPRLSIYNATKAALISFYETLRTELHSDIGITIINPGVIDSEIANEEFLTKVNLKIFLPESTERCAKAIVNSAIRGDNYLTEPAWMKMFFLWKLLFPEVIEFGSHLMETRRKTSSQSDATRNKIKEVRRQSINTAPTQSPELKTE